MVVVSARAEGPGTRNAYGCFAWIAAVPWVEPALQSIPGGWDAILLTVLAIPIVVGTAACYVVALLHAWRERSPPLVTMAAVALVMATVFFLVEAGSGIDRGTAALTYRVGSALLVMVIAHRLLTGDRFLPRDG